MGYSAIVCACYVLENVGSMGCVGLTTEDARTMFEWAPKGTRIVVLQEETEEIAEDEI